jgi:hypothetical protein
MLTIFIIIVSIAALAFLFALIWGGPSREEPKDRIIWKKPALDEHEKKIAE